MGLDTAKIINQSLTAIDQHKKMWKDHCRIVSKFKMKPLTDFENTGIGKAVLLIANGYSFEKELETIKKYQHNVDILACDKTLGHCLRNGIVPKYCIVADARVDYEKYMEPWKDQLKDTILFQNVCANPKWVENGNWKDRYFFVCKDSVGSETLFGQLSGCRNYIAAGTNVSNGMVIFLTQCDNEGRRNFFGYDKLLLIGFDYSWEVNGNYYAFDYEGGGKRYYMRHVYGKNMAGELCFTSNNLSFSAQWLTQYIQAFKLPIIQCSRHSVFQTGVIGKLDEQMQYRFKTEDSRTISELVNKKRAIMQEVAKIDSGINKLKREHHFAMMATV